MPPVLSPPKSILRPLVFISFGYTILRWETMLSSDANRPSFLGTRKHTTLKLLEPCIFGAECSLQFRMKGLCHHPIKSIFQLFFEPCFVFVGYFIFCKKTYMNHLNEEYKKFHKEYLYFRTNTTRKKEGEFQNCNLRIIK